MKNYSPYLEFDRTAWQGFRQDTPLPLTENDLLQLHGQNESVSWQEVTEVYLPLSRLLTMYVYAAQDLYKVTSQFLGHPEPKVPYIIGISGSVAVGKSTTSRVLKALLASCKNHPHVEIITTDGFLYPNTILEQRRVMHRKGFPESYDLRQLITFLNALKAGKRHLEIPVYSHQSYDILTDKRQVVDQPDIVILEGLNLLQVAGAKQEQQTRVFVSDYFDFSIYVDAATEIIKKWYLERFMQFRALAQNKPETYIYRFTKMSDAEALKHAEKIWTEINELNLIENILPYKQRAQLILKKDEDHAVQKVLLRKI
jgi:type I pantothenate kinase